MIITQREMFLDQVNSELGKKTTHFSNRKIMSEFDYFYCEFKFMVKLFISYKTKFSSLVKRFI